MQEAKITFYPKGHEPIILNCEVAKSFFAKMKGLMHRTSLAKDKGMFFPFWLPWYRSFWMKNVKISLDIIFISRNLRIINVHEATAEPAPFYKTYWSHGLCKYIVECNVEFCRQNNITSGTKISIEEY